MNKYQQDIKNAIDHVAKGGKFVFLQRSIGKSRMFYKLDKNKNVIPSSLEEWSNFIENEFPSNYWIVDKDQINNHKISTVFIGLCFNFEPFSDIPIPFETMIFDKNEHGIYQGRYATWEQAERGHQEAIAWVKNKYEEEQL